MVRRNRRECTYKKFGFKPGQFTEVVFLTLLLKGPSYGYKLMEEAINYGVDSEILTSGMAYKILRKLEMRGLVISSWDIESSEKPRRVYSITGAGKEYLFNWSLDAREVIKNIKKITEEIKKEIKPPRTRKRTKNERSGRDSDHSGK